MNLTKCNKSQLSKSLSTILKAYNVNDILDSGPRDFILSLCSEIKTFKKLSNIEGIEIIVKNISVGSRRVKMLHFKYGDKYVPIPKNKIVEGIFPTKRRKKGKNSVNDVRAALRKIIKPQIDDFRTTITFPCQCLISGYTLVHHGQIHIDHEPPFVELVERWLEENDLYYDEIKTKGTKNIKTLTDEALEKSWYDYHLQHAVLRAAYKKANIKKGSGDFTGTKRKTRG